MSDDLFGDSLNSNPTDQNDLFSNNDQSLGTVQQQDEDLFSTPTEINNNQLSDFGNSDPTGGDQMLAGDDDADELYQQAPSGTAAFAEPTPISKWNEEKQAELLAKEAKEEEEKENLRNQSSSEIQAFLNRVDELQQKRAAQNKELDEQFVKTQEDQTIQQWERVVNQIDFNRTDLHEKDVSKMKSLLLQLKNQ